ncbi:MAG: cell division protein ZapE [Gammaproteobacteria bacterium]|jgi:cell division protein ZapE|nr:cell division protein ZapE [Gammaproteobacteria bacterium]
MTTDIIKAYEAVLLANQYESDSAQRQAIAALSDLAEALEAARSAKPNPMLFWRPKKRPSVRGLYLWGGVGRGKTFLMDLFFEALAEPKKKRVHFYRFMRQVHASLGRLQGQANPLDGVASEIASQARVLCFDEFFVSDITDAMILSGVLEGLFLRGVTLIATSNVPPSGLYKDGLQRRKFLPAIAALEANTVVLNVDGGLDYRMRSLIQAPLYYEGLTDASHEALLLMFSRLTHDDGAQNPMPAVIEISGREIPARGLLGDVIWFNFGAICDGPRSQNDYIEVAEQFSSVLISGVPCFGASDEDQARRFISLVDEFYDRKVKLILSAGASIHNLYKGQRLQFEFERTQSRLLEMQSDAYLGLQHLF